MKRKENELSNEESSARIEAEKFWEDYIKMPYNNDRLGQSFVKVTWKRLQETDKSEGDKK